MGIVLLAFPITCDLFLVSRYVCNYLLHNLNAFHRLRPDLTTGRLCRVFCFLIKKTAHDDDPFIGVKEREQEPKASATRHHQDLLAKACSPSNSGNSKPMLALTLRHTS